MDINRKIESFLTKHRYEKQKTSFTILLSVLIAFCVISSLIMPAISMTIEETQNQTAAVEEVMLLGEGETPQPPAGAVDIASMESFLVSVTSNDFLDKPIYSNFVQTDENGNPKYDEEGNPIYVESYNGEISTDKDSIDLSFYMSYSGTNVTLPAEGPHLYLDLTSLINVDPDVFLGSISKSGKIMDGDWSATNPSGTFVIEDGYVKITLTPDYLVYVNSGDKLLQGSLHFSGELEVVRGR